MGLHHRYYADDLDYSPIPRTQPYAYAGRQTEMQKQIGKILREQYQPPQDLPHQLLVLLLNVDQQGTHRGARKPRRRASPYMTMPRLPPTAK